MRIIRTREGANEWLKTVNHDIEPSLKEVDVKLTGETGQTILGFGGALTESSAYNLNRINKQEREQAIKAYFDPIEGLGYFRY